jgi:hypothetical protein
MWDMVESFGWTITTLPGGPGEHFGPRKERLVAVEIRLGMAADGVDPARQLALGQQRADRLWRDLAGMAHRTQYVIHRPRVADLEAPAVIVGKVWFVHSGLMPSFAAV